MVEGDGAVCAAPSGVLHGGMRYLVISACEREGMALRVEAPDMARASRWREAFLTGEQRVRWHWSTRLKAGVVEHNVARPNLVSMTWLGGCELVFTRVFQPVQEYGAEENPRGLGARFMLCDEERSSVRAHIDARPACSFSRFVSPSRNLQASFVADLRYSRPRGRAPDGTITSKIELPTLKAEAAARRGTAAAAAARRECLAFCG